MSSSFGKLFTVTVFGQSHGEGIGAVLDGVPAGVTLDLEAIAAFLARRAPGGALSTTRKESDAPQILSGLVDGVTCGAPLTVLIQNSDTRSTDYQKLHDLPRPMHADYAAHQKYHGANDIRGGGQFSGRLTAPLCFAGAVAMQLLAKQGIAIGAHLLSVGSAHDRPFDPVSVDATLLGLVASRSLPVLDPLAGQQMAGAIEEARLALDSVGGVIECAVTGLPAGIGEPLYESIESKIAALLFSIPAVKGVEFGAGFGAAAMKGSEHNDAFILDKKAVKTATNRHGGILGGISSGMPILFRAAFKPTPSIAREQDTISLTRHCAEKLTIHGRHDPCVAIRAVPCVEAAAAIALLDLILEAKGRDQWN